MPVNNTPTAIPRQCSATLWKNTSMEGRYKLSLGFGVTQGTIGQHMQMVVGAGQQHPSGGRFSPSRTSLTGSGT